MKTRQELEQIKDFIDSAYNSYAFRLKVKTDKKIDLKNPELGYCYKDIIFDKDHEVSFYNIVTGSIGIPRTDFRILLHEYGHIYFGHLDEIHNLIDVQICNVFRDHRGELIERINKECGIDFADKLIERVIDDPVLNHSLHNIAMDMEVNSCALSTEDIEEMESDISKVMADYQTKILEKNLDKMTEEQKKKVEEAVKRMKSSAMIKLILPCRYHTSDGNPFPDGLTYTEYIIMIIKNLDQFVKMLVNIMKGGNGDTSNITSEEVAEALQNGLQSLDDLMQQTGMSDSQEQGQASSGGEGGTPDGSHKEGLDSGGGKGDGSEKDSPYQGVRDDPGLNGGDDSVGDGKDHANPERKDADEKRELGEISSGPSLGCGSSGGPGGERTVTKDVDEVDTAIDEVIANLRNKVVKRTMKKDVMWNYNRGINRAVIAPSIKSKVTMSTEPKLVFLIDISGSMNTRLIDRILKTISNKMRHLGTGRGLKYDIISWSTRLGEHIKDIDPKKGVPDISCGGGTRMAGGMKYFKDHYDKNATLILISDFEDYLEEWHQMELTMPEYTMYGFNYGYSNYKQEFKYFKVRNFNNDRNRYW